MRINRSVRSVVLLLLAGVAIGACSCGNYNPGAPIEQSKESAYSVVKPQIQNAVTAYMVENLGDSPTIIGSYEVIAPIGKIDAYVFDICAIVGAGGLLRDVPDGCAQLPGSDNDNFDAGNCSPPVVGHYIWVIDVAGNVFSICDENLDGTLEGNELADGFHYNIWP